MTSANESRRLRWAQQTVRVDGADVILRWELDKSGRPTSVRPNEVTIRVAQDADPRTRARGVGPAMLRGAERVLSMVRIVEDEIRRDREARWMIRDFMENAPDPRRQGEEHQDRLLALVEDLQRLGVADPVVLVAEVTGEPWQTIKSRLRAARRRRREAEAA